MAIEFHCEHCNKIIRAPEEAGGRQGKCPHCESVNYIPMPRAELEEIPLAPLDEDFEQRRHRAAMEDAAIQQRLLRERPTSASGRSEPRGAIGRSAPQSSSSHASADRTSPSREAAPPAAAHSRKHYASMVVSYVEAMSQGTLDKAEDLAGKLARHSADVHRVLDDMLRDDLTAYGLPALPRPVLLGFLKQLRSRLS